MGTVDNSFKDAVVEYLCDDYDIDDFDARTAVDNAVQSDALTFYYRTAVNTAEWVHSKPEFWKHL